MIRQLNTIREVDRASNIGKCLRFDSVLKIATPFLDAWDIRLDPDDPAVINAIQAAYAVEWEQSTDEQTRSVAEGAMLSLQGDSNFRMNRLMAEMVMNQIMTKKLSPKDMVVADVGCGPGGSAVAFINALRMLTINNKSISKIHLIDPSRQVLDVAKTNARAAVATLGGYICMFITTIGDAETWVDSTAISDVNLVLFGASLHHMRVDFVLGKLADKLRPGALVAVGEWCHGMLKTPAHFRLLVQNLDALIEPGILERFDDAFPTTPMQRTALRKEPMEQMAAIMTMAGGFWLNHANVCKRRGIEPLFSPFEGHMPDYAWVNTFDNYGFRCLDRRSIHANPEKPGEPVNPINTCFLFGKRAA